MATLAGGSVSPNPFQGAITAYRTVTFSNSYTTGGEAITAAQVGLTAIYYAFAVVSAATAAAVANIRWDPANGKFMAFTTTAQVSNTTDLSAISFDAVFLGRA